MEAFTTREAARILGVSRRTFNRWIETHPVERETSYGQSGVEYRYTRAALEHLLRQVRGESAASQLDEGSPTGGASEPAQGRQDETSMVGQDETPAHVLALPLGVEAVEVLRAVLEENRRLREGMDQLREVLAARLPGPPAPPSPPPRLRPRVVVEAVLLGWVGLLAGVLGVAVLTRLAEVGAVALPTWWPWR